MHKQCGMATALADGVRGMVVLVEGVCVDGSPEPGGPSEGIFWLLDPRQIMGQL